MANCPANCGLVKFSTSSSGYTCDNCSKKQRRYTEMWGCRNCNYDLCKSCYNKAGKKKKRSKKRSSKTSNSFSSPKAKLEYLFTSTYADAEDPDIMSETGTVKFFKDCGINPESHQTLMIAYHLQCQEMGIYEKDEFVTGFLNSNSTSIKEIKTTVQRNINNIQNNRTQYKKFYKWLFLHVKEDEKKKTVQTPLAIQLWNLVLTPFQREMKLLSKWLEFCEKHQEKDLRVISKDTWQMIFDFLIETESLENYDDCGGSWPIAVDEFVEWCGDSQ